MLIEMPPEIAVSSCRGYLKGKSAMVIFDGHSSPKYKFENRKFRTTGCCVSTVGLTLFENEVAC